MPVTIKKKQNKTISDIDFAVRCLFISTATVNAGGRDRELNRIPVNWSARVLGESWMTCPKT